LLEAGGNYADVMFVQLYLLDIEKIEQFNEIFQQYFASEPPARAVFQPLKLYPGALVMFTLRFGQNLLNGFLERFDGLCASQQVAVIKDDRRH